MNLRYLIGDYEEPYTFSDEHIRAVANVNDENILLTAASLLELAAQDEALTYKIVRTDDLSVDGVAAARILLSRAEQYRNQHRDSLEADGFDIVYPVNAHGRVNDLMEYAEWVY